MKRLIVRNLVSSAGQTVFQSIVMILQYSLLLRTIGVDKLGIWSVVLATAAASQISDLGMSGSVTKFVAAYRAKNDGISAAAIVRTAVTTIAVVFAVVLLIAYPLFLMALGHLLPEFAVAQGRELVPYALVSFWLTAVSAGLISGLEGCMRSDIRAVLMSTSTFLMLCFTAVGASRFGLVGLAWAQVAQGGLLLVGAWVMVRRTMGIRALLPWYWSRAHFREMIGYGATFQLNSIFAMLFEPTTKLLLSRFGTLSAVTYFELAQRMVTKARALIVDGNRVLVPIFATYAVNADEQIGRLYLRNLRGLVLFATPVFSALAALTPVISEFWIGSFQQQFITIEIFLIFSWYLNTLMGAAYFACLGTGDLRWVTIAHVLIGFLNICAGYLLGRFWGDGGAIAAFGASLVIGSAVPVVVYHRRYRIGLGMLFGNGDRAFVLFCLVGAAVTFAACVEYRASVSRLLRALLAIGFVASYCAAAFYRHPMRRKVFEAVSTMIIARRSVTS